MCIFEERKNLWKWSHWNIIAGPSLLVISHQLELDSSLEVILM